MTILLFSHGQFCRFRLYIRFHFFGRFEHSFPRRAGVAWTQDRYSIPQVDIPGETVLYVCTLNCTRVDTLLSFLEHWL